MCSFDVLPRTISDTLTGWQHLPDTPKTILKISVSAARKTAIFAQLAKSWSRSLIYVASRYLLSLLGKFPLWANNLLN